MKTNKESKQMNRKEIENRMRDISIEYKSLEEALFKIRRKEFDDNKIERGKDKCECGHERSKHGKSFNINYTDGACSICDCKHYL